MQACISEAQRLAFSMRSSWMKGLRTMTHMSPSTSNNMRAERPVTRSPRRRFSNAQLSSPRKRMTISRSEKEV